MWPSAPDPDLAGPSAARMRPDRVPLPGPTTAGSKAEACPWSSIPRISDARQAEAWSTLRAARNRAIAQKAAMLATWQSPTRSFVEPPAGFALNSLPALDQSAKDLQLFLSTNKDVIQEPNQ